MPYPEMIRKKLQKPSVETTDPADVPAHKPGRRFMPCKKERNYTMAKTKPFDTALIDKDLAGIILVSYFSPLSAESATAQIRKMVPKIPIVRLKWLLEDPIEKLSGILLCKQELKEKADMEQAVKNLKKLECRFGNRSILHICIKPDIRKTLTGALADAEKQKKTEPETEGILLRTVQETFCMHRHMKEWTKFCEGEQITKKI